MQKAAKSFLELRSETVLEKKEISTEILLFTCFLTGLVGIDLRMFMNFTHSYQYIKGSTSVSFKNVFVVLFVFQRINQTSDGLLQARDDPSLAD